MAQEVKIKFNSVSKISDTDGSLVSTSETPYNHSLNLSDSSDLVKQPDVTRASWYDEVIYQDSIKTLEGDLIVSHDVNKTKIDIDINGNLLILHEEADKYSIDINGDLIYNF